MNRDVCKKEMPDWYLHAALNPFFVGFLGLFFQVVKCKIGPPVITFDRDMLQPQRVANIYTLISSLKNY